MFYTADWSLPFGFNFEQVKRREFIALLGSLGVSKPLLPHKFQSQPDGIEALPRTL
jgi:hypothetical protein